MTGVDPQIIDAVRAAKARRRQATLRYDEHPELTFVVHSFNRIANLTQVHDGLRSLGCHELIVCDDGSVDGSCERWLELLDRPNDLLIHSNDLHEIRATDRAIRCADGEIVCLVQDDDAIPADDGWLDSVLGWFADDPALAVVGGFMGFDSFHPDPARARPVWGPGDERYVHHVNIGPYFVRRAAYQQLDGWDRSFSAPGEPGICFESEFCLRAWVNGFRVGYRFVPFKGPAGHYAMDGGTVVFSPDERERNRLANSARIYQRYEPQEDRINRYVETAQRPAAAGRTVRPRIDSPGAAGDRSSPPDGLATPHVTRSGFLR